MSRPGRGVVSGDQPLLYSSTPHGRGRGAERPKEAVLDIAGVRENLLTLPRAFFPFVE